MMFKRIFSLMIAIVMIASFMSSCAVEENATEHAATTEEITEKNPAAEPEMKPNQTEPIETEPIETEPEKTKFVYVERISEVPLYNQLDYYQTIYGDSTVARSGCGITCYAMILTYLLDREILPDELAPMYHRYKVDGGSSYALFLETQEEWGGTVENVYWEDAWNGKLMEALENGQPVIANVYGDSCFTDDGHFIVLYGLTEDGRILVRDPNGSNYNKKGFMEEGFEKGFSPEYFREIYASYFIYNSKDLEKIAEEARMNIEKKGSN